MSYYVHHVPGTGRLRVKIPFMKGNPNTAEDVKRLLDAIAGIDSTAVSTTTGSVVVNYNEKAVDSKQILDILKRNGYFDDSKVVTNDQVIEAAVSKAGEMVSKALVGLFLEKAFEGSALSLLTVLI
jgi:copper chaperone CopZ